MKDRFLALASTMKPIHERADKIRKAAETLTDIEQVCSDYRDLILDVEAGVEPGGDPILGITDWTWGDYEVQNVSPDGFDLHTYYFHEDEEEWRHHHHHVTWREFRKITRYVAKAHMDAFSYQERLNAAREILKPL